MLSQIYIYISQAAWTQWNAVLFDRGGPLPARITVISAWPTPHFIGVLRSHKLSDGIARLGNTVSRPVWGDPTPGESAVNGELRFVCLMLIACMQSWSGTLFLKFLQTRSSPTLPWQLAKTRSSPHPPPGKYAT